ncbi:ribonuclease III, partial [Staphylococcus aureus]|nr:ribonuclease III [Staphylococcus aureus]MDI1635587.1 ribonuclease III [Staphylococcus aureus]
KREERLEALLNKIITIVNER